MPKELRIYLEKFKTCSLDIINMVETDNYDQLENEFAKRQEILDTVNKINYSKEELASIIEELDIIAISNKIDNLIKAKKDVLRTQIEDNANKKNANSNYSKSIINNYHVFSKKV